MIERKFKKKKNLDETGLTNTGCRHRLAQWAVNMFYGEIYGYVLYPQIAEMISRKVPFSGNVLFVNTGHG